MTLRIVAAVALSGAAMALFAAPVAAQAPSPLIAAALSDPGRPEKDTKLDASRHPADLVAFARVKPGETVVDVWPGGGYWSRIFSKVVGPTGKVYAYVPAEIAGFKSDPLGQAKAISKEPGYGNVEAISDPLAAPPPPEMQGKADVVWTFENYHDTHDSFMKGADVAAFNKAVFLALKPGGYYVIGDQAAAPGSGLKNTEDLHRIDPAAVKAEVEKAGFVFDGEDKVLANPADEHTLAVFDPKIRGNTDRFVFRFRKPLT
jgi:predicted methyltransferase